MGGVARATGLSAGPTGDSPYIFYIELVVGCLPGGILGTPQAFVKPSPHWVYPIFIPADFSFEWTQHLHRSMARATSGDHLLHKPIVNLRGPGLCFLQ